MRHSPGFYRRLALLVLGKDLVRGGLCVLLMLALLVGGTPLWLALLLPFLVYLGVWVVTIVAGRLSAGMRRADGPQTGPARYVACLDLRREIRALACRVHDERISSQIRHITGWSDKMLAIIAEEETDQASMPLVDLLGVTRDLLAGYVTVVQRGVAGDETEERVRRNLATLESAYERCWVRLNRDAVVTLETLNETIDSTLVELGRSR